MIEAIMINPMDPGSSLAFGGPLNCKWMTCAAIQTQVLEMRSYKMWGASGKRSYRTDREIFRQQAEST